MAPHDPYAPRPRRAAEHNARRPQRPPSQQTPRPQTGLPPIITERLRAAGATDADMAGLWLRWKDGTPEAHEAMTEAFTEGTVTEVEAFLEGWRAVAAEAVTSGRSLGEVLAELGTKGADGPEGDQAPDGAAAAPDAADAAGGADAADSGPSTFEGMAAAEAAGTGQTGEGIEVPPDGTEATITGDGSGEALPPMIEEPADQLAAVPDTVPDGSVRVEVSIDAGELGYTFTADVPEGAAEAIDFLAEGSTLYGSMAGGDGDVLADERARAVLAAEAGRPAARRRAGVISALEGCLGAEAVAAALG